MCACCLCGNWGGITFGYGVCGVLSMGCVVVGLDMVCSWQGYLLVYCLSGMYAYLRCTQGSSVLHLMAVCFIV